MKIITNSLFIGLLMMLFTTLAGAQEIPVKISSIRSSKGSVVVSVFKDQASFDQEKPYKKFTFDKTSVNNGAMTVKLAIEPGIYGITLFDDENGNGKIDKNFIGIPKEGFGFSNFFMEKLKKPGFNDFKVDVKNVPNIQIRVKYL
ncbi:DUF2141 domain-containing protein [Mucilaginibacter phyllosphaerae]|uniref:DUF2141 domain-containing protein n=1 Tax=Mucilaginibacter phyllosphaerae TaxID=1812349 RepID=A0A4Y8AAV8_9SPHI|nr:DUF2141 domain-containing protein [Mucilaginibacter phyllosphaerae]MBB3969491.1 uncharacterized protein (DUF2141 family) [Mucilaginibacter phyllosphaerae]TEW65731.1 DUF2141 domain-containing protein [Mucilaginibacter phyllosphaerae]GGH08929.1 hypothetical protein GCM10007352_14200 [Mucilaginibacter phyllosphaerae]